MRNQLTAFLAAYKKMTAAIFIIACLLYANTIPNKWAIDDSLIIYQNHYVQRGVHGLDSLVTQDAFTGFFGRDVNVVAGGRWRPLTHVLFAIKAELFAATQKDKQQQLQKDEAGYTLRDLGEDTRFPHLLHFFNMLWYSLLCILLYHTLLLLLNPTRQAENEKGNFVAATATLLFTVHPLHTEAVANIKGADEIFALMGGLGALYCLLKAGEVAQKNNKKSKLQWWVAATGAFFGGLLAKENTVTYLAVIPLALWFFTSVKWKSIGVLMLPLLGAFLLFWGLRSAVLYQPAKAPIQEELMNDPFLVLDENAVYAPLVPGSSIQKLVGPNANTFTQMPFANKLATNLYTYGLYLKLLVAPYPLTVDYYPRQVAVKSFTDGSVWLSLLLHLALLGWAIFQLKNKNPLAFGILYYFITFSVSSNLFFPIGTSMAERFMFMPSVGFCLCIALLLHRLAGDEKQNTSKILLPTALLAAICIGFGLLTVVRNRDWKDNYTLFSHDVNVSSNSGKIKVDLAAQIISKANKDMVEELEQSGATSAAEKEAVLKMIYQNRSNALQESIPLLQEALVIHPMNNAAWLQLGNAYHYLGQNDYTPPLNNLLHLQTSIAAYEQADYYKAYGMDKTVNEAKAATYMDFGKLMGDKFGDNKSAVVFLEKAKALDAANPTIYYLLGTAYSVSKDYEKAVAATKKSLQLRPQNKEAVENLAAAYLQYAAADTVQKPLIDTAQRLLLQQAAANKRLPDNDPDKITHTLRVFTLLQRAYELQNNAAQQYFYTREIEKLNGSTTQ